ncbi:transketolase family protein [Alkalibaculum sp. M08DMB]|uniref:Transketolase family protein n=1 Tax=Alkalibaculum sporogenes TaxID=2655001 RepID=A0A6A7K7R6_9FIRM|nr:transketolase family protein [Alkalibaculum sporogenes]MPW25392.1 transketolase family protein [Alkalibaculum sporogenes]
MSNQVATRVAYGNALAKLGKTNKNIVVLDADLSKSTNTATFCKAEPERHFNCGIAEQNMLGIAAGLAASGKIAFASTFAVFGAGRAFEIIRNSICYPKLNVKVAVTHAGLTVGEDGATHQSIEDVAIMRSLPNMIVLCPADAVETEKMINTIVEYNGPVYIRLGRPNLPIILSEDYEFEIGKSVELQDGKDVTIIAMGIMVAQALKASEELKSEGISARVINMSTIKPIDEQAVIKAAKETGAIVTAEEHSIIGGLGSAVADVLVKDTFAPLEKVGVQDTFGESGKPDELLEKYGLTYKEIIEASKKAIARK